jgi:hypothetical protein
MNSIPWLVDSRLNKVVRLNKRHYINNTTKTNNNGIQTVRSSSFSGLGNISEGSKHVAIKGMVTIGRISS